MYSITEKMDIYPKIVQNEVSSSNLNIMTKNPQNKNEEKK